jgi:hypothetical protein
MITGNRAASGIPRLSLYAAYSIYVGLSDISIPEHLVELLSEKQGGCNEPSGWHYNLNNLICRPAKISRKARIVSG